MKGDWPELTDDVEMHYENLFEKLRVFVMLDVCTKEQIVVLKEYLELLERIIPPELLVVYKDVNYDFFRWADSLIGI